MILEGTPRKEQLNQMGRAAVKVGRIAASVFLSYGGGALAMNTIGSTEETIAGSTFSVGLHAKPFLSPESFDGMTHLGSGELNVTFPTHHFGPEVTIEPQKIDFNDVRGLVGTNASSGAISSSLDSVVRPSIDKLKREKDVIILRSLGSFAAGAFGTAGIIYFVGSERRRKIGMFKTPEVIGSVAATALFLSTATVAGMQFDPKQFAAPEKTGLVAQAEILAGTSGNLQTFDDQQVQNAESFLRLVNVVQREAEIKSNLDHVAFRIVVHSDDHDVADADLMNNELEVSPVPTYVMGLGDQTDFGSKQENSNEKKDVKNIHADSLFFLPGNHDKDTTMNVLRNLKGVQIVHKGQLVLWNIHGLRILAIGDPLYTPSPDLVSADDQASITKSLQSEIEAELQRATEAGTPYDIIATHEPAVYDGLDTGDVRGKLAGHTHVAKFSEGDGPWFLNPGSTGGAGIRRVKSTITSDDGAPTPRSYATLNFDKSCQLISATIVSYQAIGPQKSYSKLTYLNQNYSSKKADLSARCADK